VLSSRVFSTALPSKNGDEGAKEEAWEEKRVGEMEAPRCVESKCALKKDAKEEEEEEEEKEEEEEEIELVKVLVEVVGVAVVVVEAAWPTPGTKRGGGREKGREFEAERGGEDCKVEVAVDVAVKGGLASAQEERASGVARPSAYVRMATSCIVRPLLSLSFSSPPWSGSSHSEANAEAREEEVEKGRAK